MNYKLSIRLNWILFVFLVSSCRKEIKSPGPKKTESTDRIEASPTGRSGHVNNDMVMYWNEKTMAVLGVHTNPGTDSRYFAMVQIAMHDALNNVVTKFETYALHNERDGIADPNAAIASAAYWAIKGLNIQKTFPVDDWYAHSLATIPEGTSKERGKVLGKKAADAIMANRANDGFNQVIGIGLFPLNGTLPGQYRSTLPASNPALNLPQYRFVANWGLVVRPFILQSNSQFRPNGPHPVNSSAYTNEFNEVKAKGAMVGSTRTQVETDLKDFWSDLRHHIVWNVITRKIIATKNMDAWKTARLFALIHTAMADGASAMFEAIYHYYYWRPETAIRIEDDGNPQTVSDPGWLPSLIGRVAPNPLMNTYTPTVPEYPCAFSILGSITGKILQDYFESDEIDVELTGFGLPITLHYSTISKAVSDNSKSKIYAGWHFRKAVEDGEAMGRQIADYAYDNYFKEEE